MALCFSGTGKRGSGAEPVHASGLADDLGCGQRSAAAEGKQAPRQRRDDGGDASLELVDPPGEPTDVLDELQGDLRDHTVMACEQFVEPLTGLDGALGAEDIDLERDWFPLS
jgi:hypothetical protein